MTVDNYSLQGGLKREMMSVALADPDVIRDVWYTATILIGHTSYPIKLLESVHILRDFNSKTSDIIKIVFNMHAGEYIEDIKPNKDKLRIRLKHNLPGPTAIDDYKLIISLEDKNISADAIKGNKDSLNNALLTIHAECVDEAVLFLKQQNKGIIIKDGTVETAIARTLDAGITKVTGKFGIGKKPISIIKPDNNRVYKSIVIPATMKVMNVPIYLQEKLGGVYNGSINTYVYRYNNKLRAYVFPLYRPNLLKSTGNKLIIISATSLITGAGEATYSVDSNGDVRILVLQKEKLDDDNTEMLGKGGSIKGIDANTVRGRPVSISKDGVELKVKSMYRDMKDSLSDDLSDIINVAPTDNFYEPRSKILKNKIVKTTVEWNLSNVSLLYPYMPVIFLEEQNNKPVMREGVLNGIDVHTINPSKKETAVLSILITKRERKGSKPVKLF